MIGYGISLEGKVENPYSLIYMLPPALSETYRLYLTDNGLHNSRAAFEEFIAAFQDEETNHTGMGALLAACIREEDKVELYGNEEKLVLPLECPWDYPEIVKQMEEYEFRSLIRQWAEYVTDETLEFLFYEVVEDE